MAWQFYTVEFLIYPAIFTTILFIGAFFARGYSPWIFLSMVFLLVIIWIGTWLLLSYLLAKSLLPCVEILGTKMLGC